MWNNRTNAHLFPLTLVWTSWAVWNSRRKSNWNELSSLPTPVRTRHCDYGHPLDSLWWSPLRDTPHLHLCPPLAPSGSIWGCQKGRSKDLEQRMAQRGGEMRGPYQNELSWYLCSNFFSAITNITFHVFNFFFFKRWLSKFVSCFFCLSLLLLGMLWYLTNTHTSTSFYHHCTTMNLFSKTVFNNEIFLNQTFLQFWQWHHCLW